MWSTGRTRRLVMGVAAAGLLPSATLHAQDRIGVTEVAPGVLVLATRDGNVAVSVGSDGAFLVGALSVSTTAEINALLAERTRSPIRYVVAMPPHAARSDGDAGWGRLGAFVVMHETALGRLAGGAASPAARLAGIGAERPRIAYSEVITFSLNGGSIHVVHQPAAHSDADALAHFHAANLVYLGEIYPGDGYPDIDSAQGGTLDGLLRALESWAGSTGIHLVPARGPVASGEDIRAFRDMLVAARDQVRALAQAGRSADEVVAARPSSAFDARWGRGRVTPETFVRQLYRAVAAPR